MPVHQVRERHAERLRRDDRRRAVEGAALDVPDAVRKLRAVLQGTGGVPVVGGVPLEVEQFLGDRGAALAGTLAGRPARRRRRRPRPRRGRPSSGRRPRAEFRAPRGAGAGPSRAGAAAPRTSPGRTRPAGRSGSTRTARPLCCAPVAASASPRPRTGPSTGWVGCWIERVAVAILAPISRCERIAEPTARSATVARATAETPGAPMPGGSPSVERREVPSPPGEPPIPTKLP